MKNAVISAIILVIIFVFVGVNAHVLDGIIEELEASVAEWQPDDAEELSKIKKEYERHARYINLTVSHNLTSEVEEAFAEAEGAVVAGEDATEAKSRLKDAIGQLRRLTRFSFDSII